MRGVSEKPSPPPSEEPTSEERALAGEPPQDKPTAEQAAAEPPRVLVPRWVQLVVLPLAIVGLWAIAKAAGKVLVIFIVAGLIALILNPIVAFLSRGRLPRGLAVLVVYIAFFLIVTGIALLLANPISNQASKFADDIPHITKEANTNLARFQRTLNKDGIHVHFIKQGKTALQTLGDKATKGAGSIVSFSGGVLSEVASALFDLVLIFVLSIYMLLYGARIGVLVRRVMPPGDGTRGDDYPWLVQSAVARYVGGQLLFSLIMGATAALAMYVLGVVGIFEPGRTYAVVFGLFYGFFELIPYVGPILGALLPVIVALFTDPISALWVTLTFVGLQQLEGHIVAPQIFGHTLRINPLLVIFALLLGLQVHGVIGALIALPILAVLRETAVYLHRHLTFEPWNRSSNNLL
ncbi:MAG TPA: AI-2E family transporter [Solirubrobacteraceae bacterium]|nr:AI-2E family transporter [Solirubrobacteraceae bacterium]